MGRIAPCLISCGRWATAWGVPASRCLFRRTSRDCDPVRVAVAMPGFPARLALDWFSGDGVVHHLHAGRTDDSHLYVEGVWKAGKPYGDQLITALVTSDALFAQERPEHEAAAAYLKDLQAALARVRGNDARLTAGVLAIDVVPR
jgi:eukaryotic-like serine/threonine-protein kinase